MAAVLVDVGAHEGQTLDEVIDPRYGFSAIHALEPMPRQFASLARFTDHRVNLHNFGLAASTGTFPIFGTNDHMEASMYQAKRDLVDAAHVTACGFVEASAFIEAIDDGRPIIVKLNCEGAEVDILENLIATGAIWRVANVMIDFDVRKIPGQEHRESEVLGKLERIGFHRVSLCDDVMHGKTHQKRIAAWLDTITELWGS